ncbi:MAG: HigA family addiction module antitoxin [Mobilicoccus sp.]|nr:HigA family addiction module antitoxin [Mobilicoccus sp.]
MSVRHKGLELLYRTGSKKGVQAAHVPKLRRILSALDVAHGPEDLAIPSFKTHPLKADLAGRWSIWVNGNWRVNFPVRGDRHRTRRLRGLPLRGATMMLDPVHPGEILREDVIAELGLSVGEAASRLGVSRVTLSRVLNGHARISSNLAVRLEAAGAGTARMWLAMQTAHDLAAERATGIPEVRPLHPVA